MTNAEIVHQYGILRNKVVGIIIEGLDKYNKEYGTHYGYTDDWEISNSDTGCVLLLQYHQDCAPVVFEIEYFTEFEKIIQAKQIEKIEKELQTLELQKNKIQNKIFDLVKKRDEIKTN